MEGSVYVLVDCFEGGGSDGGVGISDVIGGICMGGLGGGVGVLTECHGGVGVVTECDGGVDIVNGGVDFLCVLLVFEMGVYHL